MSPSPAQPASAIFRRAATEHHFHPKSGGALPAFLQARLLVPLWGLVAAAGLLSAFAWARQAPDLRKGQGLLVAPFAPGEPGQSLALLVPELDARLVPGQPVVCTIEGGSRLSGHVERVEAGSWTVAEVRTAFAAAAPPAFVSGRVQVAHARLSAPPSERRALVERGGCEVIITVGRRPLFSYLPLPSLAARTRGRP